MSELEYYWEYYESMQVDKSSKWRQTLLLDSNNNHW